MSIICKGMVSGFQSCNGNLSQQVILINLFLTIVGGSNYVPTPVVYSTGSPCSGPNTLKASVIAEPRCWGAQYQLTISDIAWLVNHVRSALRINHSSTVSNHESLCVLNLVLNQLKQLNGTTTNSDPWVLPLQSWTTAPWRVSALFAPTAPLRAPLDGRRHRGVCQERDQHILTDRTERWGSPGS